MLEIHHFSYGWLTPVFAYFMSVTGCLLGLQCATRGRRAQRGRVPWLVCAAISIGGTGIWVMHFIAMLGFSIKGVEIRYDLRLTLFSAVTAMVVVGAGLFMVNRPQPTMVLLVSGGAIAGAGVGVMHYTGMYAMRTSAVITYDTGLVALSILIAVVASIVALWFTLRVEGFPATLGAALIMGVAVCGMHYTGMAAMHATMSEHNVPVPEGMRAMETGPLIGVSSMLTLLVLVSVSLSEVEDRRALPKMRPTAGWGARRRPVAAGGEPEPDRAAARPE